jgi:hypothetical protein
MKGFADRLGDRKDGANADEDVKPSVWPNNFYSAASLRGCTAAP